MLFYNFIFNTFIIEIKFNVFSYYNVFYPHVNSYSSSAILVDITMQVQCYSSKLYMPITHNGNFNLERDCDKLA